MTPLRDWSRREFLRSTLLALGWGTFRPGGWQESDLPAMPMRPLGKTGLQVSLLGFGGAPLGGLRDEEKAVQIIQKMIDLGVNYLDTAPSYSKGVSERRVGKAIKGRRDKVIIATKTLPRSRKAALDDLEGSLRRLGTDYVDLWQIHRARTHADLDRVFADNGPVRAGEEAILAGKVRFLGVTGHTHPEINVRAIKEYDFDAILMPFNIADPLFLSFERDVLPIALEKGMGVIGMKVLAASKLLGRGGLTAQECLRYGYSLPVSTAIIGVRSMDHVEEAVKSALLPALNKGEMAQLNGRITEHPGKDLEWYKSEALAPRQGKPRRTF